MKNSNKLLGQRLAVRSLQSKSRAQLPVEDKIDFDVWATCRYTTRVLAAIDTIDGECVYGEGFQINFSHALPFYPSCSFDCIMVRLGERVIERIEDISGLGEDDVTHISTDADWTHWEAVTGRRYKDEGPASQIAAHGKFYFLAFDQQLAECKADGESLNDRAQRVMAEHLRSKK